MINTVLPPDPSGPSSPAPDTSPTRVIGTSTAGRRIARIGILVVAGILVAASLATPSNATPGWAAAQRGPRPITRADLMTDLSALQAAADAHGNTRAAGSPGYWQTVRYAAGVLRSAGYTVHQQKFSYPRFRELSAPTVKISSTNSSIEATTILYSASGSVTGPVVPARSLSSTPQPTTTSTAGCDRSDFATAPTTHSIALVMRGGCFTVDKISNAKAAGYAGVIVFDDGEPGDDPVLHATAGQPVSIPAVGVSFASGVALYRAAKAGQAVQVHTSTRIDQHTTATNLIADSRPAATASTLLLTSQLDSVEEGPGINDSGTGLSATLEVAKRLNQPGAHLRQRVRVVLFGAEEPLAFRDGPGAIGLLGTYHYASTLPAAQRKVEFANLNSQMLGSPNWARYVLDGDGSTSMAGPPGSGPIEQRFLHYFAQAGMVTRPMPLWPGADYGPLANLGIPIGGLFTGDGTANKTTREAQLFGGTAGQPYEPCYHSACDNLAHLNTDILTQLANALNHVAWQLTHLTPAELQPIADPAKPSGAAATAAAKPAARS